MTQNTPQYYVIYFFDLDRGESVAPHKPPSVRKIWELTEGDECYEFSYLYEESGNQLYKHGKHRKYVAILTPSDLASFVEKCDVWPSRTPTMGSLTPHGHLPAISFVSDDPSAIYKGAYVTPLGVKTPSSQLCLDGAPDELWRFDLPLFEWKDEGDRTEPVFLSRLGDLEGYIQRMTDLLIDALQ